MTTFKLGVEKILRLFYENTGAQFHVRELARRTNLYGQGIIRYLKELEKNGILTEEKEVEQLRIKAALFVHKIEGIINGR